MIYSEGKISIQFMPNHFLLSYTHRKYLHQIYSTYSFFLTKVNISKTFNKYNYVKDIFKNYGVFNTLHNTESDSLILYRVVFVHHNSLYSLPINFKHSSDDILGYLSWQICFNLFKLLGWCTLTHILRVHLNRLTRPLQMADFLILKPIFSCIGSRFRIVAYLKHQTAL